VLFTDIKKSCKKSGALQKKSFPIENKETFFIAGVGLEPTTSGL
jgi:hypothetical protein